MSYGTIPQNATIRLEYVKCGNPDCTEKHGPYNYAYWKDKETKKLRKKYIGKSWEDYHERRMAKQNGYRPMTTENRKLRFIRNQVNSGNQFALVYNKKINENEVSIDWAYRKIRNRKMDDELEKIAQKMDDIEIAAGRPVHSSSDSKLRLRAAALAANFMKGCGLDWRDEQAVDNFLNSRVT